jgi:hypothetical protein
LPVATKLIGKFYDLVIHALKFWELVIGAEPRIDDNVAVYSLDMNYVSRTSILLKSFSAFMPDESAAI